jgi:RimJ/RimL family protein N-acetyltransferase
MPTDHNYYKQRWKAAKVDFNLSYGMFDDEKLVGVIIHAIDERHGEYVAFNTGTGVIPEYRGKKIVNAIYKHAIPDLKRHGITKCALEVIVENQKAIKAYEGVGFEISRTLKCYAGELSVADQLIHIKELSFYEVPWERIPNQNHYSWDFHSASLKEGDSKYYNVYNSNHIDSFFSIKPDGTINQLEVLSSEKGNWERLLSAVQTISKQVRIINVDDRLKGKLAVLENAGLKNTVNQYEMQLHLKEF